MARILVIEDEELVRDTIRSFLEKGGHEVSEAIDDGKGLEDFHKKPADLVVTDVLLPEIYGLEVIRKLRREFPTVPIIAITGYDPVRLSMAKELGADHTFLKPFSFREFLEVVDRLLLLSPTGA